MRKLHLVIVTVVLILGSIFILSGCQKTEPYLKDVSTSLSPPENQVAPGDSFKIFISVENPTRITFTPYIEVSFNTSDFDANNYGVNQGRRLELEPIEALGEKSYFLVFEAEYDAKVAKYPFTISLYGDEGSKNRLGLRYVEYINVARRI